MNLKDFKKEVLPIKDKLFRFALSLTADRAEAEDIVQEVLIKTWRQRSELGAIRNLEAWCIRLTRNLTIDKLRSKHRHNQPIDQAFGLTDGQATPHEQAESHDLLQQVNRIMRTLPEKQQLVMHLRDIEGLTYQEIGEALQLPVSQVKVNLHRARAKVRQALLKLEANGKPKHQ